MNKKFRMNYIFHLLYRIVTMLTPLITSPFISRVFGAEGIGSYSYSYSITNFFVIFALLGVSDYGVRCVSKTKDDLKNRSKTFFEIYSMQLFLSIISIIIYFIYFSFVSNDRIIALIMSMNIISAMLDITWYFFGIEKFVGISIRNICVKTVTVILILVLVKSKDDIWIYTLIMCGGTLFSQLVTLPMLKNQIVFTKVKVKEIASHFKPNIILFLPVIASSMLNYFDKVMIGSMSTLEELGCYDNAEKIVKIPNSVVTALGTIMLPKATHLFKNGKMTELKNNIQKSITFILACASALCFGIMGVAQEFVPLFFGPGFDLVITLLLIMCPIAIFVSLSNVFKTQLLLPMNKDKIFVNILIFGALLNIVLNSCLIGIIGSIGAAIATFISEAAICCIELVLLRKHLDLKKLIRDSLFFIGSGIIMTLSIVFIKFDNLLLGLFLKIIIGVIIYSAFLGIYWLLFMKKNKRGIK